MKHHHIAAVFLLICGGLLAYTIHQKNPAEVVRMAIFFTLLAYVIFFYEKLPPWLRPVVIVLPVSFAGLVVYRHVISGNIVFAIVTCIALILVGAPMLNRDKPSVKETIRPWLNPAPYVGIVVSLVSLVVLLLSLFLPR